MRDDETVYRPTVGHGGSLYYAFGCASSGSVCPQCTTKLVDQGHTFFKPWHNRSRAMIAVGP